MPTPSLRRETELPNTPVLIGDSFRMGPRYDNWRPQGAPSWLLIFTAGGAGRVGHDTESVRVTPGTVTLYAPGAVQRYGTDPETRHWHLLWSHFHPRPHWTPWLNWQEPVRGVRVAELSDPALVRNVRTALTEMIRHAQQDLPSSTDLAMNALERALLWIHSSHDPRVFDDRVRFALDHLAEHLREPFSITDLARACHLSVSRLAHLFREQVGVPPQHYLEGLRLARAKHLLQFSSLRIAEIAEEAGFSGAFYFSHRFRKRHGVSPSQFRKSLEK